MKALLSPLFARLEWAQPASVVAGMSDQGAALIYVRLVGVGPASHCGGGHDRSGVSSGLCSLAWLVLRQPLWCLAPNVIALLRPLSARLAWAQPSTVVAGKTVQGAALASARLVGVVPASHFGGGTER